MVKIMSTTRILWTLLLTGTLAATGTEAQSIAQHGQSRERQDSRSDEHSKLGRPWAIVGSWFGTTASGLKQLITFHADGTVLRSVPGEVSIAPARPPHTAAHGVWRYLGKGRFGVTIWDIFYDVNTGQLLHYMKLRLEVTLKLHRGGSEQIPSPGSLSVLSLLPPFLDENSDRHDDHETEEEPAGGGRIHGTETIHQDAIA